MTTDEMRFVFYSIQTTERTDKFSNFLLSCCVYMIQFSGAILAAILSEMPNRPCKLPDDFCSAVTATAASNGTLTCFMLTSHKL